MKFRITNRRDAKTLEDFLVECANVRVDGAQRLIAKYPGIFPDNLDAKRLQQFRKMVGGKTVNLFAKHVSDLPQKEFLVYVSVQWSQHTTT